MPKSIYQQVEEQTNTVERMAQAVTQAAHWFENRSELTPEMMEHTHAILMRVNRYLTMIPRDEKNVMLEVVGFDESRQIEAVKERDSDRVSYLAVVNGTSKASIDLRTPRGQVYRFPIEDGILEAIVESKDVTPVRNPLEGLDPTSRETLGN